MNFQFSILYSIICLGIFFALSTSEGFGQNEDLDDRVQKFLEANRNTWRDMNVPYQDGEVLYNLIVDNNYTSALEIGTSTGHSTMWIAWAMSKTGGKVITLEIDERRQKQALEHLSEVGLLPWVDARLTDAHVAIKDLEGPFDFVFSDADKGWYTEYFKDVDPKLQVGGCFTAHNVRSRYGAPKVFLDYLESLDNYETTIDKSSTSGISISFKKSD